MSAACEQAQLLPPSGYCHCSDLRRQCNPQMLSNSQSCLHLHAPKGEALQAAYAESTSVLYEPCAGEERQSHRCSQRWAQDILAHENGKHTVACVSSSMVDQQ